MEVYAAYLSETDYEVNRVIQAFKDNSRYDNMLIIYIDGDNGASAEGTVIGTSNEFVGAQGMNATVDQMAAMLPEWGGPKTYPHFAVPWAFAMDTPFQWTKQIASYFGGTGTPAFKGDVAIEGSKIALRWYVMGPESQEHAANDTIHAIRRSSPGSLTTR